MIYLLIQCRYSQQNSDNAKSWIHYVKQSSTAPICYSSSLSLCQLVSTNVRASALPLCIHHVVSFMHVHNGNFLLIHFICHTGNWRCISMRYNLTHQRHWFQYHHQDVITASTNANETHSVRQVRPSIIIIGRLTVPFNFNFSTHHHHGRKASNRSFRTIQIIS